MHISIPVDNTIEVLNFTPVNPLISKCQIKVCYVGENRNHSVISKEVATEMAKSLPGCPIVGFYNSETKDFEEHNRIIDVSGGKFNVIDTTRPYGFVDLNAKVWFQKFVDDGVEHEYLMTEGFLWTGTYEEAGRVIEHGNNQSMELHPDFTKGTWTNNNNEEPEFFIINESVISKLCILGEKVEPCFEGAGIAASFSFDEEFKTNLFSAIKELQNIIEKGGQTQMDNEKQLPIDGENTGEEMFKKSDEEEKDEKKPPFPPKDEEKSESKSESEDKDDDDDDDKDEKKKEKNFAEEKKCPECGKPVDECTCEKEEKKEFSLEENPVYIELKNNFSELTEKYNNLLNEIESLREFKKTANRAEKQAMIDNTFYMLSDNDKADVIANIDNYSLDDIEAKLSIICVRNKVNFSLDDDKKEEEKNPTVYALGGLDDSDNVPAWIKAVRNTANKNMY